MVDSVIMVPNDALMPQVGLCIGPDKDRTYTMSVPACHASSDTESTFRDHMLVAQSVLEGC